MNAVIYARFSCDNQKEESIEGQLRVCKKYAEENGINIIGEYIDRAKSARTDKRANFQKMIADSINKTFSAVLLYASDRFARNVDDAVTNRRILKQNGVKLLYATEFIPDTPAGILIRSVMDGYNEYFSAELSLKVTRGMTENALKCKSNGSVPPLGYKTNCEGYYEIDPETAPAARQIFEMYANGKSITQICKTMNDLGIKSVRGREFGKNSLTAMLKKQMYIGTYVFKDIKIENGVPALIEPELFEKVQEKIKANHKHPQKHLKNRAEYILSGKLYCGLCDNLMTGSSGRGRHGGKYYYYVCKDKKNGCQKATIPRNYIEDIVIDATKKMILNPEIINQLAKSIETILKKSKDKSSRLIMYKAQLAETEKSLSGIIKAIEAGIITDTTKERLLELEAEKKNLKNAIAEEETLYAPITEKSVKIILNRMMKSENKTEEESRKEIADKFIHKCFLFDDKIIIAYNISDKTNPKELLKEEIHFLIDTPPENNKNNQSKEPKKGSSVTPIGSPIGATVEPAPNIYFIGTFLLISKSIK